MTPAFPAKTQKEGGLFFKNWNVADREPPAAFSEFVVGGREK